MFGIAERGKYDILIFYVKDNRCKETQVKKNVYTYLNTIIANQDSPIGNPVTRIYSDCWNLY